MCGTDGGTPTPAVTYAQITDDASALGALLGPCDLSVAGVTVTDGNTAALSVTAAQFNSDAAVLNDVSAITRSRSTPAIHPI